MNNPNYIEIWDDVLDEFTCNILISEFEHFDNISYARPGIIRHDGYMDISKKDSSDLNLLNMPLWIQSPYFQSEDNLPLYIKYLDIFEQKVFHLPEKILLYLRILLDYNFFF